MSASLAQQRHVVAACYLGWTLDAFDFFIMIIVLDDVAKAFSSTPTILAWAIFLSLAMRPVGAFIFGRLADRFGRRPTLMANVLIYSLLEMTSGFAPNLTTFMILRALYGVAMGGEWGVGSSLTMESIPARWRGPVSGLLQAGYPSGFLLATVLYRTTYTSVGWRGMFIIGVLPALLVLYIRRNVPESPDWVAGGKAVQRASFFRVIWNNKLLTLYAVFMMAGFNFFSHGTQDLYKSFLTVDHKLPLPTVSTILICMNIAAIVGGMGCAWLSQRIGRRAAIVGAALLALPVIHLWAFSTEPLWLGVGAFLMQLCVQGAWGVIPAHLNELSPPPIRATFPGLAYQLGNLLAASNANIQRGIANAYFHKELSWALAGVAGTAGVVIALLVGFGTEARDRRMGTERVMAPVQD
jgi:SHS family lactate transporter-like MFS transporter